MINALNQPRSDWVSAVETINSQRGVSVADQMAAGDWAPLTPTRGRRPDLRPVPGATDPAVVPAPAEVKPAEPDSGWCFNQHAASFTLVFIVCVTFEVETRAILGAEVWREVRDDSAWVAEFTALLGTLLYAVWLAVNRRNRD
jgi:hypothetical protein